MREWVETAGVAEVRWELIFYWLGNLFCTFGLLHRSSDTEHRLARAVLIEILKGANHARSHCGNPVTHVVVGNGHVLYGRRVHTHPVGDRDRGRVGQGDPGPKACIAPIGCRKRAGLVGACRA